MRSSNSSIDGTAATLAPVFRRLRDDIRRLDPDAVTVLNPGVAVPPALPTSPKCWSLSRGHATTTSPKAPTQDSSPCRGTRLPTRRFGTWSTTPPEAARAAQVIALSRTRGADLVDVTDSCSDNPYLSLPSDEIWTPSVSTLVADNVTRPPAGRLRRSTKSMPTIVSELLPDTIVVSNPTLSSRRGVIEAATERSSR